MDFHVTVPSSGNYSLAIRYRGHGTQGLRVNKDAWRRVAYPDAAQLSTARVTVRLHVGNNTIRLAKGSPGFTGGVGVIDLDSMSLHP